MVTEPCRVETNRVKGFAEDSIGKRFPAITSVLRHCSRKAHHGSRAGGRVEGPPPLQLWGRAGGRGTGEAEL